MDYVLVGVVLCLAPPAVGHGMLDIHSVMTAGAHKVGAVHVPPVIGAVHGLHVGGAESAPCGSAVGDGPVAGGHGFDRTFQVESALAVERIVVSVGI